MTAQLDVIDLDSGYDSEQVLNQLTFCLRPGQIGCMLGPSGCGKTTVLRAVAGFEPAWAGKILIDQVEVSSTQVFLPPEKRNIGMVFQDFALFPHLRVEDNIRFGLQDLSTAEQQSRIDELLATVGMPNYART